MKVFTKSFMSFLLELKCNMSLSFPKGIMICEIFNILCAYLWQIKSESEKYCFTL